MTWAEFDSLYLHVRWFEDEPSSGFHRVLVSPITFRAICDQWSWVGQPPAEFASSTLVGDGQIVIER